MKKFKIDISFIIIVILIILSPKQVYFLKLLFCLIIHELGHLIICLAIKIKINRITLYATGFLMDIENDLLLFQSILLYIGGIFFNLLLCFFNIDKDITKISLFLAIINLIPIYPLDGHQILKTVLEYFFPVYKVYVFSSIFSIVLLVLIFILSIIYSLDLYLLFNFIYLGVLSFDLYKNRRSLYHSFILNKYLYPKDKKYKILNVEKSHIYYLFRYHNVIFSINNKLIDEKVVLKHYFNS